MATQLKTNIGSLPDQIPLNQHLGSAAFVDSSVFQKVSFYTENTQTVVSDTIFKSNRNYMSAGPILINDGVAITIQDGSVWTVV